MGIILKTWGHFGQCWEISEAMKLKISLESSNKFCGCVAPRSWLSLNIRYIPQKSLIIPMISSGYHELCWWSHLSLLQVARPVAQHSAGAQTPLEFSSPASYRTANVATPAVHELLLLGCQFGFLAAFLCKTWGLGKNIAGWWYTYPSEKYESQIGSSSQVLGKIKHVPNHQPDRLRATLFPCFSLRSWIQGFNWKNMSESWSSMVPLRHGQSCTLYPLVISYGKQKQHVPLSIVIWLVVWTPLKNMRSSVGMMTFPTEWKN